MHTHTHRQTSNHSGTYISLSVHLLFSYIRGLSYSLVPCFSRTKEVKVERWTVEDKHTNTQTFKYEQRRGSTCITLLVCGFERHFHRHPRTRKQFYRFSHVLIFCNCNLSLCSLSLSPLLTSSLTVIHPSLCLISRVPTCLFICPSIIPSICYSLWFTPNYPFPSSPPK